MSHISNNSSEKKSVSNCDNCWSIWDLFLNNLENVKIDESMSEIWEIKKVRNLFYHELYAQKIEQILLLGIKKKEILSKFLIRINKHFTFNFTSHWNLCQIDSFVALLSSYNKVFKSSRYSSVND